MTIVKSKLYQILSFYHQAPTEGFAELERRAKVICVPPNQVLMELKEQPRYFYLVKVGLLRAVYTTSDGKEYIKEFFWENDVIFGIRHLITHLPLPYSVSSVEHSELFQIPVNAYRDLVATYSSWKDYHIREVERHLLYKEIKEELLLLHSNEERVAKVYQLFPNLVERVPATLIAAYLGLSPVSLSRIKKRLLL